MKAVAYESVTSLMKKTQVEVIIDRLSDTICQINACFDGLR